MMELEEWREVEGWPYEVSDWGRVRRSGEPHNSTYLGRVMQGSLDSRGYHKVHLQSRGRRRMFFVHRLVADAFVSGWGHTLQVNHISGDKTDNCPHNLEWVTAKENEAHATATGLHARGVASGKAKLNPEAVRDIRTRYADGEGLRQLAWEYGVHHSSILKVVRRESWAHIE